MQDNLVPRLDLAWLRRVRRLEICLLPSDTASASSSPSSRPFDFDSGIKDMRNHFEKEAVGRQTAPAPEISTPTPSSDDKILDVSGYCSEHLGSAQAQPRAEAVQCRRPRQQ